MAMIDLIPEGYVMRMAASFKTLAQSDCTIPERCIAKQCQRCTGRVHWDPMACIPILGPEWIVCDICIEEAA